MEPAAEHIRVAGRTLETAAWGPDDPSVVFVHDGLGSIAQWGDVPAAVAARSGRGVLAYNRAGHGASVPVPSGPHPPDWMAHEAHVLAALVEQRAAWPVRLVGHSDGGTIALLCAVQRPDLVDGVVALAAHSWVERKCVTAIAALRHRPDGLIKALARYHDHPAALFEAWSGGWTSAAFATWDIRPELQGLTVPTVVAQGDRDEYATDEMLWSTAAAIGANGSAVLLPDCGHGIHRDRPDAVVDLAVREP
jgi:pimeloyl-ACP methyl ester carboxylesterase